MKKYQVEFYTTLDGKIPAKDFLESLNSKMLAKTLRTIELLEEFGPELRLPYSKHLEGDIFEIRIKHSSNISHVLYFFVKGQKIILTNGFVKKSLKTNQREIEKAIKYCDDYRRRVGK